MATRPLLEPAACPVFAPYIEELHEFLATDGLPFGSPADLAAVTDRLRQRGPFSDDLSSLVRSWVLREGGAMPHAQLIEILTLAIAGPETATTQQQYSEPLRQLFAFVAGVMRRPWSQPPRRTRRGRPIPRQPRRTLNRSHRRANRPTALRDRPRRIQADLPAARTAIAQRPAV